MGWSRLLTPVACDTEPRPPQPPPCLQVNFNLRGLRTILNIAADEVRARAQCMRGKW